MNYWDKLMETDEGAANYMTSHGEGVGTPLRFKIGGLLKPGEWVLDVGCGPGLNFDHFLEHGPSVKYRGIDYSERFVRVASERVKPMKIFDVGDARNLSRQSRESFDVVILQDVLEHTNGYEKPVIEALRVARRRIIVTFWRMGEGETDQINDDGDDGYGAAYSRDKWEKFLDTLPIDWTHDSIPRKDTKHDIFVLDKT